VRLLTLTGPGGVGKTRLALHVAAELSEHFTDGTWFVSLAPISDPDLVIPAITQTLGLREARDQSPLEHLKSSLHEKKTLLLLDNFEHVASAATQVADLLGVCRRLKVLATSREALHVRAEREFPVPALALPDLKHLPDLAMLSQYEAVALFIERAQAVKPDFQVTNANAPAVAEICSCLDGLPLAIELAAARIKLFPPQELLTRLGQRLQLLTSSLRDVPARQQTLRKTIQWSYDLLATQEQHLFRRLSVFSGGCTLQAIEAVSAALGNETTLVLEEVASLIDKNLLQQTTSEGEELRLTMLETIREYGLEPQDAPMAEARRNVTAANLGDRIELRAQRIEDLADREAFDLVWLPQVFLPREVLERGLRRALAALRPGGWDPAHRVQHSRHGPGCRARAPIECPVGRRPTVS
jgi:predicted ATPase